MTVRSDVRVFIGDTGGARNREAGSQSRYYG